MCERIAIFAGHMTMPIAGVAGDLIEQSDNVGLDTRIAMASHAFDNFKIRYQHSIKERAYELFSAIWMIGKTKKVSNRQ